MKIREALETELEEVLAVHLEAFQRVDESHLVGNLLKDESAKPLLSLFAFQDEKVAGHIVFTNAWLEPKADLRCSLLAPLAVLPEFQKQGVGGTLIRRGFEILKESGIDLVFVLGYPSYYSRYEFEPAGRHGLQATYPIAEKNADAWMVKALQPNALGTYRGRVICADALNKQEYWIE